MLDPIVLTKYGDLLVSSADTKNLNDSDALGTLAGDHLHYNYEGVNRGSFAIFTVSRDWHRMSCRMCNLVVEFPIQVKTYGDLRKYFTDKLRP
jgi:hypothetical protein